MADTTETPEETTVPSKLDRLKTKISPFARKALILGGTALGFLAAGVLLGKALSPADDEIEAGDILIIEELPVSDEAPADVTTD